MKQLCLLAIAFATISCNSQVIKNKKYNTIYNTTKTEKTTALSSKKSIINSYSIIYEETKNIENQLSQIPEALREQVRNQLAAPTNYQLTIIGTNSIYEKQDLSSIKKNDKSDDLNSPNKVQFIKMSGKSRAYKNTETLEYLNETTLLGKDFLIADKMVKIDWKLSNEAKKIGTFDCKKATAFINDIPVEAWYTSSIPVTDGPDDFWGLPGLIVEVKTESKHCIATQISPIDLIEFEIPSKGKKVTKLEFEKAKKESIDEIQNSYKSRN